MLDEIKEISVKLNAYNLLSNFTTEEIAEYIKSKPRGWNYLLREFDEMCLAESLVRRLGLRDAVQTLQHVNEWILKEKPKRS